MRIVRGLIAGRKLRTLQWAALRHQFAPVSRDLRFDRPACTHHIAAARSRLIPEDVRRIETAISIVYLRDLL